MAFYPGTIRDSFLAEVAQAASEAGDIRLGFSILLTAGQLAEERGQAKVKIADIRSATKSETTIGLLQKMDELEKQLETRRNKSW